MCSHLLMQNTVLRFICVILKCTHTHTVTAKCTWKAMSLSSWLTLVRMHEPFLPSSSFEGLVVRLGQHVITLSSTLGNMCVLSRPSMSRCERKQLGPLEDPGCLKENLRLLHRTLFLLEDDGSNSK